MGSPKVEICIDNSPEGINKGSPGVLWKESTMILLRWILKALLRGIPNALLRGLLRGSSEIDSDLCYQDL